MDIAHALRLMFAQDYKKRLKGREMTRYVL